VNSPRRRPLAARFAALFAIVLGLWPRGVSANDFDQFQNARVAYDSLNYELAADLFRGLLANASPNDSRPLVLESRKYLGAALLFMKHSDEADQQFELLLQADPSYVLDPLTFPEEVNRRFDAARKRLEHARAEAARAKAAAATNQQAVQDDVVVKRREKIQRLIELAGVERVERQRSRWIAMMPFGIGQFQNQHESLGLVLAVSEGVLLGAAVTSYFLHESLRDEDPKGLSDESIADARLAEAGFRYSNRISLGLFAAVAIAGIVDAQVRFKPSLTYERRRPLPKDLQELDVAVGPGGVAVSGRF
jgi:tetratricopeptide (TPR) repeat protein